MIKKLLSILFLLTTTFIYSQRNEFLLVGKVIDSIGEVKNVNIVNLANNQGTSTNDFGEFRIYAEVGDSLRISSIQHEISYRLVTQFNLDNNKYMDIFIKRKTYILDEVVVKKHDLSNLLELDRKKTPKDKKDQARLSMLENIKNLSQSKEPMKDDHIDSKVRPPATRSGDPTQSGKLAGAKVSMPFKHSERLWALRRSIAFKSSFPELLLSDLGRNFFFVELKIPNDQYHHFLDYLNNFKIETLYKEDRLLEVVKILRRESKNYLKLIETEGKED